VLFRSTPRRPFGVRGAALNTTTQLTFVSIKNCS
jgi:hypothetical protein